MDYERRKKNVGLTWDEFPNPQKKDRWNGTGEVGPKEKNRKGRGKRFIELAEEKGKGEWGRSEEKRGKGGGVTGGWGLSSGFGEKDLILG